MGPWERDQGPAEDPLRSSKVKLLAPHGVQTYWKVSLAFLGHGIGNLQGIKKTICDSLLLVL